MIDALLSVTSCKARARIFFSLSQTFDITSKQFFDEEKLAMFSSHYNTSIDSVLLASQVHSAKGFIEQKMLGDLIVMNNYLNHFPIVFSAVMIILLAIHVTTSGK